VYLIFLFFLSLPFRPQISDSLPHGSVIDTVIIKGPQHYSYALYIPSNYESNKAWPVIFGMDPVARGIKPVQVFKAFAEHYGYVVAGSNNSRNGPIEKSLPAVNAMISDVAHRLHIDNKRIYLTGFSGGARLATYLAVKEHMITGVIACGAGFPSNLQPGPDLSFSYVSTVGNADMNYPEMIGLRQKLNAAQIPNHLIVFNGTHQWPDSASAQEAIRWLQLDAMRRRLLPADKNFIQRYYAQQIHKANLYEKTGKYTDAYRTLQQTKEDIDHFGFVDIKTLSAKIKALEKTKSFRRDYSKENKIKSIENDRIQRYLGAFRTILNIRFDRADELKSSGWWEDQIKEIHHWLDSSDPDYVLLGKRLDQFLKANAYEYHRIIENNWHDYHRLVWLDQVWVLISPKSARVHYLLARSFILDKQTDNGLAALKKAVELGYKNYQNLKTNPDFKSVRNTQAFKEVLKKLER